MKMTKEVETHVPENLFNGMDCSWLLFIIIILLLLDDDSCC